MTGTVEEFKCGTSELCLRPLLRRAFGLFWDHAKLLVAAHMTILVILLIGNQLLTVGGNVLLGPFFLGLYTILLRIVRNENTEFSDLLSGFEYFLPAFVANILIHLATFLAAWILVVPGVLATLLYWNGQSFLPGLLVTLPGLFAVLTYAATFLFILERNLGFWDAMEASRKMVWGNLKRWLVVGLVIILLNLAGFLCCLVGLLVTLPFSHLLITLAYEEEQNATQAREEFVRDVPPPPESAEPASE